MMASSNYVEVKTGKHLHVLRETLPEMEAKLDPAIFIRIHRPTVINAEAVQHVESVYRGRVRGDNAGGNAVFFEP